MKRFSLPVLIALLSIARFSFAQSPHTISYQAYIAGSDGLPKQDAKCPVHVEILNADDGNAVLWSDDLSLPIKDGLLNLELGSHTALPPSTLLDHKLAVGVRLRGSPPMISAVTATPYALNVPDNSITAAKMGTDYVSAVTIDGMRVTTKGGPLNLQAGEGLQLSYNEEANAVRIGVPRSTTPNSTVYWSQAGNNSTSPVTDYIGTGDNVGLEIHVNDASNAHANISRVIRLDPRSSSPVIIMGYGSGSTTGNKIAASDEGSVVGGGGQSGEINQIQGDYSVIAGGGNNSIYADSSVISGGYFNTIEYQSGRSFIGGGDSNYIDAYDSRSTIAGGHHNMILPFSGGDEVASHGEGCFIGGGDSNLITMFEDHSDVLTSPKVGYNTIAGGYHNVSIEVGSFVGGGAYNTSFEEYSTTAGGDSNSAIGAFSFIGGGRWNATSRGTENLLYQSIGGGWYNRAHGYAATIAGGDSNMIDQLSSYGAIGGGHWNGLSADYSAIGGGDSNRVTTGAKWSFIGGGHTNQVDGVSSFIGGGDSNLVDGFTTTPVKFDVIGGGSRNTVIQSTADAGDFPTMYATIGGGYRNSVKRYATFIGGGEHNEITMHHSTIGGGYMNKTTAEYCVVGGGYKNLIEGRLSVIGGGDSNRITNVEADHNFIGGGQNNVENNPSFGVIGGGFNNTLDVNAWASAIAGGQGNSVRVWGSFLGAGRWNTIEDFSDASVINGGESNTVKSMYSVIGGGQSNTLDDNSDKSVIGGGRVNHINTAAFSVIAGGDTNTVLADNGAIGGGAQSVIDTNATFSTVGGGIRNYIHPSAIRSTISGGSFNHILTGGKFAAIPGGDSLVAQSYAQTVIGFNNVAKGGFVKGTDPSGVDDALLIVGNGKNASSRQNAFEISYDGHSTVFDKLNNKSSGRIPVFGATYNDNLVDAWGDVTFNGATWVAQNDFGVANVIHLGTGKFAVVLQSTDPLTGMPKSYSAASITVTVSDDHADEAVQPGYATSSHIGVGGTNTFIVRTYSCSCSVDDRPFFFKVSGR